MDARLAAYLARVPVKCGHSTVDPLAGAASPSRPFTEQLRSTGLLWRACALCGAHAVETVLMIASWGCIGVGALNGRMDRGWLAAWVLCLASTVPLRAATRWWQGIIAVGFGGLLKQRMLAGAMGLDADVARRKGAGELLGEVLEADQIERLGVTAGLDTMTAVLQLMV